MQWDKRNSIIIFLTHRVRRYKGAVSQEGEYVKIIVIERDGRRVESNFYSFYDENSVNTTQFTVVSTSLYTISIAFA